METVLKVAPWETVFDNDLEAWVPEIWANESLMVLENAMVMMQLVHRDFSNEIQQFGDIVNTRRPGKFYAKRKGTNDDIESQDATAVNVAVPLDQHIYTSFIIRDGEESKGFRNLVNEYLVPAVVSMGRSAEQILLAQMHQFQATSVGKLGTTPAKATLTACNRALTENAVPSGPGMRNLIVTPSIEEAFLNIEEFTSAEKVGDDGSALREASLGRKFGLDTFMTQNAPSITAAHTTTVDHLVNLIAGYPVGTTTLVTDSGAGALAVNTWVTIAGDDTPQLITASTGSGPTTSITIEPGLKFAVLNNAVITNYTPGDIDEAAGYAAGYQKEITTSVFTVAPENGQIVTFDDTINAGGIHGFIDGEGGGQSITEILVDRPLEAAVSDADAVNVGPLGEYGFAFHRNAIAWVSRPLAEVRSETGVQSAVVNFNGLSIRVVITYDPVKQGHRVTVDMLAGVKVLDPDLGCLLYG